MKFRLFLLSALFCNIANASAPAQAAAAAPNSQEGRLITQKDAEESKSLLLSALLCSMANASAPAQAAAAAPSNPQKGRLITQKDAKATRKYAKCFYNLNKLMEDLDKLVKDQRADAGFDIFLTRDLKADTVVDILILFNIFDEKAVSTLESILDKMQKAIELENIARQNQNHIVTAQAASAAPAKKPSEYVEELD